MDIERELEHLAWEFSELNNLFNLAGKSFIAGSPLEQLEQHFLKTEQFLFEYLHLLKSQDSETALALSFDMQRPGGIISSWNELCSALISELTALGLELSWHDYLIFNFSKKLTTLEQLTIFENRFNLVKALLQIDINSKMNKLCQLVFNEKQFTLNYLGAKGSEKKSQIKFLASACLNSFAPGEAQSDPLKPWAKFWEKSSGGILASKNLFSLDSNLNLSYLNFSQRLAYSSLIGVDENLLQIKSAATQFIKGQSKANIYLWGEPGTGKSSAAYGLCQENDLKGLILVDIKPDQISILPAIIQKLSTMPEKFILIGDDWQFVEGQSAALDLKMIIDNYLTPSNNIILLVTSNGPSLIEQELKPDKSYSSKQKFFALDDRFAIKIYFEAPRFDNLKAAFFNYAKLNSIKIKNKEQAYSDFQRFCLQNQMDLPAPRAIAQFFSLVP